MNANEAQASTPTIILFINFALREETDFNA